MGVGHGKGGLSVAWCAVRPSSALLQWRPCGVSFQPSMAWSTVFRCLGFRGLGFREPRKPQGPSHTAHGLRLKTSKACACIPTHTSFPHLHKAMPPHIARPNACVLDPHTSV
eukprot:362168-Chlamydomonas_euryale.AAC.3